MEIAGAHLGRRPQGLSPRQPTATNCSAAALCASSTTRAAACTAVDLAHPPRGSSRAPPSSGQWAALENDTARLLLRVAGQLAEAAAISVARLGLLSGVPAQGDIVFGTPLDNALAELDRFSLIERLAGADLRLHPLLREFAQQQTSAIDTPDFRRACALNLLGAYQDVAEIERQCAQRGVDALEADLSTAMNLLPTTEDTQPYRAMLQQLLRMLQHESHILRGWDPAAQPALFLQQWRKRALISREPEQAKAAGYALSQRLIPCLDLRWTTAGESTVLERTLSGHEASVHAVAVTADGRLAVSASEDDTLKVWDLSSGAELYTLRGHTREVWAVAVTAGWTASDFGIE